MNTKSAFSFVLLQTDMLILAVYETKWYNLPPHFRKIIIILLMQVQNRPQLLAFNMYPLNSVLYIRSLNIVYSIISVAASRKCSITESATCGMNTPSEE